MKIPRAPQLTWNEGEECVTEHYTIETSQQGSQETPNGADGTEPLWDGESFALSENGNFQSVCPPYFPYVNFSEYVPSTAEDARFHVTGPITKIGDLGYTVYGRPMARYRLPEMVFNSTDGRYSIYGGTIGITCLVELRRVLGNFYQVELQIWRAWGYDSPGGVRYNRSPLAGGGDGGGWGWSDDGSSNGSGDGWSTALQTYLSGGGCTAGFEIWVDDDQKCDAYGNAMT